MRSGLRLGRPDAPAAALRLAASLTLLVLVAGLAGCVGHGGHTRGIEDPAEMKRVVLRATPVGSSLESARRFMEQEGFTCSMQKGDSFVDHEGLREGIDYLWCDPVGGLDRAAPMAGGYRRSRRPSAGGAGQHRTGRALGARPIRHVGGSAWLHSPISTGGALTCRPL